MLGITNTYHIDEAFMILECLSNEDTSESDEQESVLSYTRKWVDLVNRGGLYVINDCVFSVFQAIELALQEYIHRTLADAW